MKMKFTHPLSNRYDRHGVLAVIETSHSGSCKLNHTSHPSTNRTLKVHHEILEKCSNCCCCHCLKSSDKSIPKLRPESSFSKVGTNTINTNTHRHNKQPTIVKNLSHHNDVLISKNQNYLFLYYVTILKLSVIFIQLFAKNTNAQYIRPTELNQIDRHYFPTANKTGQFSVGQLCSRASTIPVTRIVEGASLVSTFSDTELNCAITFKTKNAHQHFIIHFEELKLGCDDHLILFDQDSDYGQPPIHDYSCRDNMANVRDIRTSGTFLTLRFIGDSISQPGDGFRIVLTAVFDTADCPAEYTYCRDHYCISRSLFCDGIYHCLDKSDEVGCHGQEDPNDLPYALGLLVVLVLAISTCVIIFIATIYCRRDTPYSQYQQQLQRAFEVPMQASSSIMFPNHQPQYQFVQPAQIPPDYRIFHQQPIVVLCQNPQANPERINV